MRMNRKGDIAVNILVIMTLVLIGTALISFTLNLGKTEVSISDARLMENLGVKEKQIQFYLGDFGEKSLLSAYFASADNFESVSEADLKNNINTKFKGLVSSYPLEQEGVLKKDMSKLNIELNGDIMTVKLSGIILSYSHLVKDSKRVYLWGFIPTWMTVENSYLELGASYSPEFNVQLNLSKIGLHSFNDINSAYNACAGLGNAKQCMESKLGNFEVDVQNKEDGSKLIIIKSKKKFVVDGMLKGLEIHKVYTMRN